MTPPNRSSADYDSLGRPLSEINSYTNTWVSHNYDLYDQWKSTWVGAPRAGTPQMNHIYDPLRRLSYVDVRGQRFATYDYGASGTGGPLSSTLPQRATRGRQLPAAVAARRILHRQAECSDGPICVIPAGGTPYSGG